MSIRAAALAVAALAPVAAAQGVFVTIENTLPQGNFSFTPVWLGLHDGGWDTYDLGVSADMFPWVEPLAEDGMTMPLMDAFAVNQPAGVQTTLEQSMGPPVYKPGQSESVLLDPGDPTLNRWFSFASMVVPSNDLFFANGDPMAHELFDAAGNFLGPIEISIFGRDVLDAGTEVNDGMGAAFSTRGGMSSDENGVIRAFFTDPADQDYLDSFIGTGTADGDVITGSFGPDDLVGRITIVPSPAPLALLALAVPAVAARRRR